MSIIFNEEEYAKKVLNSGVQRTNKKWIDMQMAANYLREQNYNDKQIENELHFIAKKSFVDYNRVRLSNVIDKQVKNSKRFKLKRANEIIITQNELNTILSEESYKIQHLLFVYLVLSKYYMSNNNTDKYYVGCKDTEIFNLCDMYTRKQERLDLMHYITVKGYIYPTQSMSSVVTYVDEDSEVVMKFVPDDDMVYHLEQYQGGLFVNCEICNKLTKKTNNRTKYCRQCARNQNSSKVAK